MSDLTFGQEDNSNKALRKRFFIIEPPLRIKFLKSYSKCLDTENPRKNNLIWNFVYSLDRLIIYFNQLHKEISSNTYLDILRSFRLNMKPPPGQPTVQS